MIKYTKFNVFLWFFSFLCLLPSPLMAIGIDDLACQALSGQWTDSDDTLRLEGALCRNSQENYNFYNFDFKEKTIDFAPHAPNMNAPNLRFLHAHDDVFLYADGASIYGVSEHNFKVIWQAAWTEIDKTWIDDFDKAQIAVLEQTDENKQLHVLRLEKEKIVEAFSMSVKGLLDVTWLSSHLIVLESDRLRWSRRLKDSDTATDDQDDDLAQPKTSAVPHLSLPIGYDLPRTIPPDSYQIDAYGVMTHNQRMTRIYYYSYHLGDNSSSYATNATARVRTLHGSQRHAIAVTNDMLLVRIVARFGPLRQCHQPGSHCWGSLSMRYEAKYWKLPQREDLPILMASEETMALDGGSDNRAQTVDTRDPMRWRRMALINYGQEGRLGLVRNDEIITLHDQGPDALIRWNAYTGNKIATLKHSELETLENHENFGQIAKVKSLKHAKNYDFLFGKDGRFVVLDHKDMSLSKPYEGSPEDFGSIALERRLAKTENAFVIAPEKHSKDVKVWDLFGPRKQRLELQSLAQSKVNELQSHSEKWYGYCSKDEHCFIATTKGQKLDGRMPAVSVEKIAHRPPTLAWLLALLSVIIMVAVTMWRRGVGKTSLLEKRICDDHCLPSDSIELLDNQGRRFITERDRKYFLAPRLCSKFFFRLSISLFLGLGISLAVAYRYYLDDSLSVFLSWIAILGIPVFAATWILSSWTYWNRLNLLSFGRIVEGTWKNCAKPMQSIVYSPTAESSFELKRNQWKRADFVPIIIFDPKTPDFAVQYTGECNLPLSTHYAANKTLKPARTYDISRFSVVLVGLILCICSSQYAFKQAYPKPLGAWELDKIEANSKEKKESFVNNCLKKCSKNSKLCEDQCQHRQMRIVFKDAGVELDSDPLTTAAKLLKQQKKITVQMREQLQIKNKTCQAMAEEITQPPIWPESFSQAFWANYGQSEAYQSSEIQVIHQGILDDVKHFEALCTSSKNCAQNPDSCPTAPACTGDVKKLKTKVCAFQKSLNKTLVLKPQIAQNAKEEIKNNLKKNADI